MTTSSVQETTTLAPQLLTEAETAAFLGGVSLIFLRKRRQACLQPCWIKIGRSVRYDAVHLLAWLAANTRGGSTE